MTTTKRPKLTPDDARAIVEFLEGGGRLREVREQFRTGNKEVRTAMDRAGLRPRYTAAVHSREQPR